MQRLFAEKFSYRASHVGTQLQTRRCCQVWSAKMGRPDCDEERMLLTFVAPFITLSFFRDIEQHTAHRLTEYSGLITACLHASSHCLR